MSKLLYFAYFDILSMNFFRTGAVFRHEPSFESRSHNGLAENGFIVVSCHGVFARLVIGTRALSVRARSCSPRKWECAKGPHTSSRSCKKQARGTSAPFPLPHPRLAPPPSALCLFLFPAPPQQFQGLFLVHKLHFIGQVLNVVWNTLFLLEAFRYGDAEKIIAAIIVYPIFMIYFACMIRVLSEIAVSVLLVPGLLAKANGGTGAAAGRSVYGGDNSDLAAYGVHVSDDGGTIV